MSKAEYGVVAVGNALVDVLSHADDAFIDAQARLHGMQKGAMTLIDTARAEQLYADMAAGVESSGGSAANTMAGFASFGGRGAFIGKVADDQLGAVFSHDIRAQGVSFTTPVLKSGEPTGRCLILVTPDAQRTMNTFLGASVELGPQDIDKSLIAAAQVTYLEGYLFDREQAKQAFIVAAQAAHEAGRRVALTLSDPFCVGRHREDFLNLVEKHVDILFANEEELKSLYQQSDFDSALAMVGKACEIAAVTRSEKGAVVVSGGQRFDVPAAPVRQIVDTTGAGDQFAAGFLYGFTQGMDTAEAARLGTLAAAEVISHMGPRPALSYAEFLRKAA